MIDYITAKFPCDHDFTTIPQFRARYAIARLKNNSTSLEIKSVGNGSHLVISGNPAKFLQGHNIFGSNDLQGLCRDLFALVTKELNITVSGKDQQAISAGRYSLSRVDLASNFRLSSREMVTKTIREIEWHWRELGFNVSNYGDKTVYRNQYSKVEATKFYNKRREINANPLPEHILGSQACNLLRKYAENFLRVEFTLRSPALKKLGLHKGLEWSIAKTQALIREKIASQALQREVKQFVLPSEYSQLKPELRQIYHLWLQGNDLRLLFEERTLHRRRKSLEKFNIDIKHPPSPYRISTVSLGALLSAENLARRPKFAKRLGLIYFPNERPQSDNKLRM